MSIDAANADYSSTIDRNKDSISTALKPLIMRRDLNKYDHEFVSDSDSEKLCLSALVALWRSYDPLQTI